MRALLATLFLVVTFLPAASHSADSPSRDKGISMHLFPKTVAELTGEPWGLTVSYTKYLAPERAQPVVQSAAQFLSYVRKQSLAVQENGVWIVTTHPDSYSQVESALLENVKLICRKEKIPLFIVRGSELPDGWKRYDRAP